MKKNILIICIIIVAIAGIASLRFFFSGPEDLWICENGQWINYGHSNGEMPSEGCGDNVKNVERTDKQNEEEDKEDVVQDKSNLIKVETPKSNDTVFNPLIVKGEARGQWFFESSFPIKLFDDKDNLIAMGIASAIPSHGGWMTESFVPFIAKIEFDNISAGKGSLVLEKDNPSGISEYDDELRIPVVFE